MSMSGVLAGKRILIFQQRQWGTSIGHYLARKLQEEQCKLAALTFKKSTHTFTEKQTEVQYELIFNNDAIVNNPKSYLADTDISLVEVCKAFDIDSIWSLVMALRNHVRSYREKYYYGFKQNISDDDIVLYVKAVYKYLQEIFKTFQPQLILSPNFVSLPHIMCNLLAESKNITMLAVTDTKVRDYFIFTKSYQDDKGSFHSRIDLLNKKIEESPNRKRAQNYIEEFRKRFKSPIYIRMIKKQSLKKQIKNALLPYRQILRWYIKGPSEDAIATLGVTLDNRTPKIILRDYFLKKKYKRFIDNCHYYPFDKLKQFIYFPLQVQPEASIDVTAPYFSNQIEVARQVALSMPDDYVLAVKEHPGMVGLRPPSYLEKIIRTPNVKFIDYRISSEQIIKNTALVISIGSTTLAEAAFLKKPAIQLGNLGTTLALPNVVKHTDMTTLSKRIKEVLKNNFENTEYERLLENYVAAIFDTGFQFDYLGAWKNKETNLEGLWDIYKNEIEHIFLR